MCSNIMKQSGLGTAVTAAVPPPPCKRCEVTVAKNCGMTGRKLQIFRKCVVNVASYYNVKSRVREKTRPLLQSQVLQTIIKPCRVMLARLSQTEDLPDLLQFHTLPRTVRQRMENCQLLCKFNSGYQDDIFDQISLAKRTASLLSSTSSSGSEDNLSVTPTSSSTGPLLPWPVARIRTPTKPNIPTSDLTSFQHCAYLHNRLKEKKVIRVRRTRSSKRRLKRGGRDDHFKEMVGQVKAATEGEEVNPWTEDDSGVESYFSDVGE